MTRIVTWAEAFAMSIGGPGLFIIAFLDSSFLSLPEINDILVMWMVIQNREGMIYYALMATLGSVSGCLVLYYLGRKGGEAVLRKRFQGHRVERATALFKRYGVLAVVVPAILPPPAPFKVFVLLAGVTRVPVLHFVLALVFARGFRYFAEGLLALRYGDQATEFLGQNGRTVALIVGALVLAGMGYLIWRNKRLTNIHQPTSDG